MKVVNKVESTCKCIHEILIKLIDLIKDFYVENSKVKDIFKQQIYQI